MRKIYTFILKTCCFVFITNLAFGQTFNAISGVPVDLDAGSTNYGGCSSPGNKSNIQFSVSGVGTLSATNALSNINIEFSASCGGNLRDVGLYIKSPSGTCMRIYNGAGLGTTFSGAVNLIMKDGSCLNEPISANLSTSATTSTSTTGNFGVFDANATSDMATVFNGENADGTWTIYAFESAASAPCVANVSLEFGNPTVVDKTADGDNCSSPIIWQGGPICASTSGKNPSTFMPGSLSGGTSFGTIGGTTCAWNGNNNNDVWVKFIPNVSGNTCLSISGLDFSLQSIIVSDANIDGDNDPCTYSGAFPNPAGNDPRWDLVSCSRNGIYTTTSGSQLSQQHCFTANANQTYYLVVDGNGGAESAFYITGTSGSFAPLPIELISFTGINNDKENILKWQTAHEVGNNFFEIEKSENGYQFTKIQTIQTKSENGQGAQYEYADKNITSTKNFYRLKQIDIDGKFSYSNIVLIINSNNINLPFAITNNNQLVLKQIDTDKKIKVSIYDLNGKEIYTQNNSNSILLPHLSSSIYILKIVNGNKISFQKIVF